MDSKQILTADVLDIIFEGRNKSYGAYEMRKTYNKRLLTALLSSAGIVLLLYSGYLLAKDSAVTNKTFIHDTITLEKAPEKKIEQPEMIPPKPKEIVPLKQIQNVIPLIVPDKEAKPIEAPPTQEEMEEAKISFTNKDGGPDTYLGPPVDGVEKGIISEPKPIENPDSVFIKVEIESEYPGGTGSWTRFLIKTLSNYPEEAAEKGIQGTVVVKFIVDREGNISEVEAESGPQELRETAVKAIRKSGKWIPAQQNGRKVNSYKRQPITFQMGE